LVLNVEQALGEHGPFLDPRGHLDAYRTQVPCDDLGDLRGLRNDADRRVERHGKLVDTGLGEQGLRLFRVVLEFRQPFDETYRRSRARLVHHAAVAAQQALDDRLFVDGVVDRLADTNVVERLAVVEHAAPDRLHAGVR